MQSEARAQASVLPYQSVSEVGISYWYQGTTTGTGFPTTTGTGTTGTTGTGTGTGSGTGMAIPG